MLLFLYRAGQVVEDLDRDRRAHRHGHDVDEAARRVHERYHEGRGVRGGQAAYLVVVDVVLERGELGGRVRRQLDRLEAGAVGLHACDVVLPVAERRGGHDGIAEPLQTEDLVLRGDLPGSARVRPT